MVKHPLTAIVGKRIIRTSEQPRKFLLKEVRGSQTPGWSHGTATDLTTPPRRRSVVLAHEMGGINEIF
jgi:hypothetical protein